MLKRLGIVLGLGFVYPMLVILFGQYMLVNPGSICANNDCSIVTYLIWGQLILLVFVTPVVVAYSLIRFIIGK